MAWYHDVMSTCKKYSKNPGRNTTIEKFLLDFADPLDQALGIDKSTWPCCIIHDIDNLQHRRTHQFHRFHVATRVCFCYDLNSSVPPGTLRFFWGGRGRHRQVPADFWDFLLPKMRRVVENILNALLPVILMPWRIHDMKHLMHNARCTNQRKKYMYCRHL